MDEERMCYCGSGQPARWHYDARGIALCKACVTCAPDKLAGFRPGVLTDPDYWHDEPIEEE